MHLRLKPVASHQACPKRGSCYVLLLPIQQTIRLQACQGDRLCRFVLDAGRGPLSDFA